MLGYVKIDKGELKVREYEIYCGYYCGVCKSIGQRYGQLPRMALSYDAAFLAVLLASLDDTPDALSQEHCIVHHIKKKTIVNNDAIDYAADVMLILAWYKLMDDAKDEGKLYAKTTMLLLSNIFKKLRRKYPALCKNIEENLQELSALEKSHCDNMDMAADAFSHIMEAIFCEGVKKLYPDTLGDDKTNPESVVRSIGFHMGKWIYLIDAVDDIEENISTGAYNPLLFRFGYDDKNESPGEFRARIDESLRFNLFHCLAVTSDSIALLDIKKNQGIIDNVIYLGLNRKTEEIITRTEKKKQI